MDEIKINHLKVKTVLTKSNLPIAGYSVNPYVGCTQILLCLLYEKVYRAYGRMGNIS